MELNLAIRTKPAITLVFLCGLALSCAAFAEVPADKRSSLFDKIRPRNVSPGAPKISDVCFSSRWPRPMEPSDPHDTTNAAKSFHATKVVWTYIGADQTDFVAKIKDIGMMPQGAINTDVEVTMAEAVNAKKDVFGKTIAWRWDRVHLCPNAPATLPHLLKWAERLRTQGVSGIQVDDWDFWAFCQVRLPHEDIPRLEKCYCDHCIEGFRRYLNGLPSETLETAGVHQAESFNYREYLHEHNMQPNRVGTPIEKLYEEFGKDSLTKFWDNFRAEIDRASGQKIAISANNFAGVWQPIIGPFDYGMAEMPEAIATPQFIYERLNDAFALGKAQVFSIMAGEVSETRRRIATITACGGNALVPWDIFMGPEKPRYFGQPSEYSDIYGFIRANARYLDGFEDAAVMFGQIKDERWESPPFIPAPDKVFCMARVNKNDASAPVVVHLIDWTDSPEPFIISIDTSRINPEAKYSFELLVPASYSEVEHNTAQEAGKYDLLSKVIPLEGTSNKGRTEIRIPTLSPWGILLIKQS